MARRVISIMQGNARLSVIVGLTVAMLGLGVSASAQNLTVEGRVGIGTMAPEATLHVSGGGDILLDHGYRLLWKDSGGSPLAGIAVATNNMFIVGANTGYISEMLVNTVMGLRLPNNTAIRWTDSTGTPYDAIKVDENNVLTISADANYISEMLVNTVMGLRLPNNTAIRWTDSAGTPYDAIKVDENNVLTISADANYIGEMFVNTSRGMRLPNNRAIRWTDSVGSPYDAIKVDESNNMHVASVYVADVIFNMGGNVGIGTSSPSYKLHVNGDAAGTSWTNLSSREYKQDVAYAAEEDYQRMLREVSGMQVTTYKYKKELQTENRARIGFIAEEMPQEVLSKDGNGVDVYELVAYSIGAMKALKVQQDAEVATLKTKIEGLNRERSQWHATLVAYQEQLQGQEGRLQRLEALLNK